MTHKCEYCGKKYKRKDFYEKHIEKCPKKPVDEFLQQMPEAAPLEDKPIPVTHARPRRNTKGFKITRLINYFDTGPPYPMDAVTRHRLATWYYDYYDTIMPNNCLDCDWDDIYSGLRGIYNANK